MNDSILTTVKKMLGITEEYEHFDQDIIMHINATLFILTQLGIGPKGGLMITDKSTTWLDFAGDNVDLGSLQTYVYLRVKLMFDPPLTSSITESMNRLISELEWRMYVTVDSYSKEGDNNE